MIFPSEAKTTVNASPGRRSRQPHPDYLKSTPSVMPSLTNPIATTTGARSGILKQQTASSPGSVTLGHKAMKQQMAVKNEHNLPTYFQIGRNSLEHAEQVYVHDPNNRGLSNFSRGKKYNIPV